jgi:ammonium transporter Rh
MMNYSNNAEGSLKLFGRFLIIIEAVILLFYGIFVRILPANITTGIDPLVNERYGAFQDTNVMMLIGFGFLMTFMRNHSFSALSYTFFINAIVVQLYILAISFWDRIFNGFSTQNKYIYISQTLITNASFCVASVLIAFGGVIGRVGPKQLLVMAILQTIGYSLNEIINIEKIVTYDAGGSTTIHIFGAYFGLGVSWVLNKKIKPQSNA